MTFPSGFLRIIILSSRNELHRLLATAFCLYFNTFISSLSASQFLQQCFPVLVGDFTPPKKCVRKRRPGAPGLRFLTQKFGAGRDLFSPCSFSKENLPLSTRKMTTSKEALDAICQQLAITQRCDTMTQYVAELSRILPGSIGEPFPWLSWWGSDRKREQIFGTKNYV